jgi:hypothetical protein
MCIAMRSVVNGGVLHGRKEATNKVRSCCYYRSSVPIKFHCSNYSHEIVHEPHNWYF